MMIICWNTSCRLELVFAAETNLVRYKKTLTVLRVIAHKKCTVGSTLT